MTLGELKKYIAELEAQHGNMNSVDVVLDDVGAHLPPLEDIERVEATRFVAAAPAYKCAPDPSSDPPGWQRANVIALRFQTPRGSVQ